MDNSPTEKPPVLAAFRVSIARESDPKLKASDFVRCNEESGQHSVNTVQANGGSIPTFRDFRKDTNDMSCKELCGEMVL